ncbi:bifunctional monothiol glutaredoxin-S16, chloroplastic [Macadamia integrifolia]|uniref:bifunctional monothiol glutaredoxin-S16, chloroplastic n=1 Tax=Macadamia integrifolia TaxID=60698 RepID=UPI001C4F6D86|nr:bifunctional monothiol glutaredoxin-S16, chloroplastic [Macadamia integrifolia]
MAAINPSTLSSSSFYALSARTPRNAPNLSFYSHLRRSTAFPSLSSKLHKSSKTSPSSSTMVTALKKLSETELFSVPDETEQLATQFPSDSGVYAVYDENNDLQFIGISRSIGASILSHRKSVPDLCHSVKVGVVNDPDRTALTQAWKSWMEEHIEATGKVPTGNESGNTTWIRQPPQKKKPDLRLTPGRHVQLTVPLEELIERLVKENKVVAFIKGSRSAPLCGFSQRVVGILESEGMEFESVDVLDEEYNFGLRESLKRYSNWPTLPQVFVNGELVGGCDIISSMHEKGELASLFSKSN